MRTIDQLQVDGKTVLLQMGLDVPIKEGEITDDSRLAASLPTIHHLLGRRCRIVITGHVGRPEGQDPSMSTAPVARRLQEMLGVEVKHIPYVAGPQAKTLVDTVPLPGVAMLENIRYESGEEEASEEFAKQLAMLADAFVNDDYPDAHRAYACNVIVPTLLPSAAGITFAKEAQAVRTAIDDPSRPLVLIVGGAKADKIGPINHLLGVADTIIVGGVLANTFLKASGADIQGSRFDERSLEIAGEFLRDAEEKFLLPVDAIAASEFSEEAEHQETMIGQIPAGWMIMDIGHKTIELYSQAISEAKTVIWAGPIGVFEMPAYRQGTEAVAQAMAKSAAFTLVAGGDSGAAVHELGVAERMSHVSIGGGATLKLIAGEELPAENALRQ